MKNPVKRDKSVFGILDRGQVFAALRRNRLA
jgi:hypothetical protein